MSKCKALFKRNWLILLILATVMIPIIKYHFTFKQYLIQDEFKSNFCQMVVHEDNNQEDYENFCENILKQPTFKNNTYSNVMCQKIMQQGVTQEEKTWCEKLLTEENKEPKTDFYTMFSNLLLDSVHNFNPLSFLFIAVPTLVGICKILKRKHIINALTRESYKSFLIDFFKKAYKYFWVLPFIALFMIGLSIATTSFDHTYSLVHNNSIWELSTIQNRYLFIIGYVSNITLYSIFFINLALILARKYHNTFVAIIVSYLYYIGIEIFFELILKTLIYRVFHSDIGHILNIMNLWIYSDSYGLGALFTFSITMTILSFIGVYFAYRNKESFVLSCEKNN